MPHRRLAALGLLVVPILTLGCPPSTETELARSRFSKDVGCALDLVGVTAKPELSAHDMTFSADGVPKEVRAKYDAENHVYLLRGCSQKLYYFCRRGDKNRLQCIRMNVAPP